LWGTIASVRQKESLLEASQDRPKGLQGTPLVRRSLKIAIAFAVGDPTRIEVDSGTSEFEKRDGRAIGAISHSLPSRNGDRERER